MSLSSELISQFVKSTRDEPTKQTETTVPATTVLYNGKLYARLDGSDLLTPVSTTADFVEGERVNVLIKNHTATVTGNISSPAARTDDLQATDAKVDEAAREITEFQIIMAAKVTTTDLEAIYATIESLKAKTANFDSMSAITADIDKLKAKYADLEYVDADTVTALNADIDSLKARIADISDLTTDDLDAMNADIDHLKAYNAQFTYVSADVLEAIKANVKELEVQKLSAKEAEIKYANIDFTNIGEAAMEYLYAQSGLIRDVVVDNGTITGHLIGVTISGDLIEGNTIAAEKLVIKGEDGLYYKLNVTEGNVTADDLPSDWTAEQKTAALQSGLHGSNIIAHSITAEKVSVSDLVAFDATIGGFNITANSLYSGVKSSVDNTTRGIYLDNTGQIAIGDSSKFIKYYKDTDGSYKLEISAKSVKISSSSSGGSSEQTQSVEDAINNLQNQIDTARDEITTNLRIESSRGTVFKNDAVSTVLSAVVYRGSQRITDLATLKAAMGNSAYLQWSWQRLDESTFGTILSTDSRLGNDGFTFTLSPSDVDTKVTFLCQLITD